MNDHMKPISFAGLMQRAVQEYRTNKTIWNVKAIKHYTNTKHLEFAENSLENPLGVAAGPHTQMAQNIIACYVGGARMIELKTVQRIAGEDMKLDKPCIRAEDEAYNVEWSTELTVAEARDEYIKAWIAIHALALEFKLGDPSALQFNMSVGYNLEGIAGEPINSFLDDLHDAKDTACFAECTAWLRDNIELFEHLNLAQIEAIPTEICQTVTLSTMHGCPASEIEQIASHLMVKKHLRTFIKLNPTLLGFEQAKHTLADLGYEYIQLQPHHFEADLQLPEAVALVKRLRELSAKHQVAFGVKLSNTLPVSIAASELPGKEMYMSGKSLYALTIQVAALLVAELGSDLELSYCGGADKQNVAELFAAGFYPISVCTTLLKPTGYNRLMPMADELEKVEFPSSRKLDLAKIQALATSVTNDKRYQKTESAKTKAAAQVAYDKFARSDKKSCRILCQSCVHVCPNRANEIITVGEQKQILHVDSLCNYCGNCQFFCVEPCLPYLDRYTVFATVADLKNSEQDGFCFVDADNVAYRTAGNVAQAQVGALSGEIAQVVSGYMAHVVQQQQ